MRSISCLLSWYERQASAQSDEEKDVEKKKERENDRDESRDGGEMGDSAEAGTFFLAPCPCLPFAGEENEDGEDEDEDEDKKDDKQMGLQDWDDDAEDEDKSMRMRTMRMQRKMGIRRIANTFRRDPSWREPAFMTNKSSKTTLSRMNKEYLTSTDPHHGPGI